MKHILGALGTSFCLACFFSPIQAETGALVHSSLGARASKVNQSSLRKPKKASLKAAPTASTAVYCDVMTAERQEPYPPLELGGIPYPLYWESIKLASAGNFSLDETKTILTVNKGGIYEVNLSFHPFVAINWSDLSSTGFIWWGLALSNANGALARFRFYSTPTNIQGTLTPENYIRFTYNMKFSGTRECLLSLPAGTQLRLNVERSFTEFTLVGDSLNPGLRLTLHKIADLPV